MGKEAPPRQRQGGAKRLTGFFGRIGSPVVQYLFIYLFGRRTLGADDEPVRRSFVASLANHGGHRLTGIPQWVARSRGTLMPPCDCRQPQGGIISVDLKAQRSWAKVSAYKE
jgi:hypothetical protein